MLDRKKTFFFYLPTRVFVKKFFGNVFPGDELALSPLALDGHRRRRAVCGVVGDETRAVVLS
jgi:hypothetical protein